MARGCLIAVVTIVAVVLWAPLSAHARTPCDAEEATPTPANSAQVSDAIFCLSNQIRASYGLPAFRRDTRLDAAATLHSADMAERRFFAHTTPEGLTPSDRGAAQGYTIGVGENIAFGYSNARDVVVRWMASAGHCRNVLSSAIDVGVGTIPLPTAYYTQDFGDYFSRPTNETARSGCPYVVKLDELAVPAPPIVARPAAVAPPRPPPPPPEPVASPPARPSLSALSLSPGRFRTGGRGTTISYTLSAPATVTFRIQRAVGRRGRYRTLRTRFTDQGSSGANTLRFKGRPGTKPGRYRLQAVARDAGGDTSTRRHARFVLVRR